MIRQLIMVYCDYPQCGRGVRADAVQVQEIDIEWRDIHFWPGAFGAAPDWVHNGRKTFCPDHHPPFCDVSGRPCSEPTISRLACFCPSCTEHRLASPARGEPAKRAPDGADGTATTPSEGGKGGAPGQAGGRGGRGCGNT